MIQKSPYCAQTLLLQLESFLGQKGKTLCTTFTGMCVDILTFATSAHCSKAMACREMIATSTSLMYLNLA